MGKERIFKNVMKQKKKSAFQFIRTKFTSFSGILFTSLSSVPTRYRYKERERERHLFPKGAFLLCFYFLGLINNIF